MQADEIVSLARQLSCDPPDVALAFARLVADHCAELAEECPPGSSSRDAARRIREAFRVGSS